MKRFLVLSTGRIIDIENVDFDLVTENVNENKSFGLVIKGEKLFKVYKSKDSLHYEDERIELGFIVFETDNENEAKERSFEYRIEHVLSLIEEERWKDCNRYNDCSSCWRFSENYGACTDEIIDYVVQKYHKNALGKKDMETIQSIIVNDDIDRKKIRNVILEVGKKIW